MSRECPGRVPRAVQVHLRPRSARGTPNMGLRRRPGAASEEGKPPVLLRDATHCTDLTHTEASVEQKKVNKTRPRATNRRGAFSCADTRPHALPPACRATAAAPRLCQALGPTGQAPTGRATSRCPRTAARLGTVPSPGGRQSGDPGWHLGGTARLGGSQTHAGQHRATLCVTELELCS